jgi:flagellar protein FlaJ
MIGYKGLATILFGRIADKYQSTFYFVKDSLLKADMKIPFRTYVSVIFLTSSLVFLISMIALIIILRFFETSFLMGVVYTIFIPLLSSIVSFAILIFLPHQIASRRKREIETNLPFVLTHMGAIAESGIPPHVIFKLIGEFEEYGEIAKEMKKITRNIESFGIDPLKAVKEVAERTPSDAFKQVLLGYVSTTESGGNIKIYLRNAGQQALFEWRMRRERFLQQLSAYAEFYTGILIAAPLFIISLFAVMNVIQPTIAGYGILDLMKFSIYIFIPVLNTGFLFFLRGVEVEM